jgi:hypothetical protein
VREYEEAITLWERGVAAGLTHWLPDLVLGYRNRFGAWRQTREWKAAADDVIRVLVHLTPFLHGGSLPEPLRREFDGFVTRLPALSPEEREKLYVFLGERKEDVKKLIEG